MLKLVHLLNEWVQVAELELCSLSQFFTFKGVTDKVKARRSTKKRGKNVTWFKNLVQETSIIPSEQDMVKDVGDDKEVGSPRSSFSDSDSDSFLSSDSDKPGEGSCGELDANANFVDGRGEPEAE